MQLSCLRYVSEKREKDFNKLNIDSVEKLVRHFPRDYLDMTHVSLICNAYNNDVILTVCEVLTVEVNRFAKRPFVKCNCRQGDFTFTAIWFNQIYVASRLERGDFFFYGRVSNKDLLGVQMINPSFEPVNRNSNLKGLIPVYPLSGSLTQGVVRASVRQGLSKVVLQSLIPVPLQRKYRLMPLKDAYYKVHKPLNAKEAEDGAQRVALEEYFLLISAFKVIKGGRDDARLNNYSVTEETTAEFISRFPFSFTQGQRAAVREIYDNLHSPHKMNRLLQGDVGCGKTAVALTAMFMAVKSGYQAAMISPTEVLARQNAELIKKYFPDYDVAVLTGSSTAAEKKKIKAAIAAGFVNIVCGTHAVLQDDVRFFNLALAVCDEQHRFGVAQRSSLSDKGEGCDVLIMSATPIPRTLSLIFYGDLDITTIKDKPAARAEVSTSVIPEHKISGMYRYVQEQAALGNQTYFVCPKIEGDEEGTVMSVTELYEELCAKMPSVRIALLHGKMKEKAKAQVMEDFRAKRYDCLVSTTVIEVGVDVPDATVMIIYNAERFGLSSLHQLRGRVGRGDKQSYCFLLPGIDTEDVRERLTVIKNSNDGFKIAEEDLRIRGGGDFMGTRQSGRVLTDIKNLKFPVETIFTAKAISDEAFSGAFDTKLLSRIAAERYESLKDVILN